ncbi:MAG: CTP synthase [Candidatus Altiarchaeota archaeon]|nr:CTP synthase [Candidatus Altiarchaeota archaeon]
MPKYIVVTGGVMSGLGKGILSASIGNLLQACGYSVTISKIDPYVNIDAGTMSPFEHGEVFVLDDGGEVDLDFGHYERFVGVPLTKDHNLTTGKIFSSVIKKERRGDYLGKTVQIVPHVTNEIKDTLQSLGNGYDFIIVEVGGTVGDIEGMAFMEALRQLRGEKKMVEIHLTHLPLAGIDQKTKPTQHSVIQLRKMGISPDIIVGRCEELLRVETQRKLSLFCNVSEDSVISDPTLNSVYELPSHLAKEGLHQRIQEKFNMSVREPDMTSWTKFLDSQEVTKEITVGIVGKYSQGDTYLSIMEALTHAGAKLETKVKVKWIDAENIKDDLQDVNALITPGGFGKRGAEGKIKAIKYARKNKVPWLGLCLGFQLAVVEMAQNELGLNANSTEFDANTEHPVIIPHWEAGQDIMGGTMRLGAIDTDLEKNCQTAKLYSKTTISERHRHRYGLNPKYKKRLEEVGMHFVGTAQVDNTLEIFEISNQFFIGVQFHPELKSRPLLPHPLFLGLVKAALTQYDKAKQVF